MAAVKYMVFDPEDTAGTWSFEKEYKGEISLVAKKAWRDMKVRHKTSGANRFNSYTPYICLTNVATQETVCFDLSGWKVASKSMPLFRKHWVEADKNWFKVTTEKQKQIRADLELTSTLDGK